MKLEKKGNLKIEKLGGYVVGVSYDTPIGYVDAEGTAFMTAEWYSKTTSRHYNYFRKKYTASKVFNIHPEELRYRVTQFRDNELHAQGVEEEKERRRLREIKWSRGMLRIK